MPFQFAFWARLRKAVICIIGCVTILVPALPAPALAAIPQTINYQSRLLDTVGLPITAATDIQFSLYLHPTNGAYSDASSQVGPLVWKEDRNQAAGACAKIVPDAKGYFFLNLGSCSAFPTYLKFDQPLYLGVRVGADAEALPRILLAAFPYAMNSQRVGSFVDTGAGSLRGEAQGTSTALVTGVNSAKMLLQGSGWNGAGDVYREMKLLNTVTDANTYRLSLLNDSDTEVFSVDNAGTASTSSMYVTNNLFVRGIRVDAVGSNNLSSGAYLVGVFDEFANSNATTVQAALRDFDLAISAVSSSMSIIDLQRVTNQGNTTTLAIQFAGGTSTADFSVQGQLNATGDMVVGGDSIVTGTASSTAALFVNATGTNLFLVGQLHLGNFNSLPAVGTPGSIVYATASSTAYLWDGAMWQPIATGSVSAVNLQSVTDRGNMTNNSIQFAGGTSTANILVQGNTIVTGITSSTNVYALNTTSTNLFAALFSYNNASGTNLLATNVTTSRLFVNNLSALTVSTTDLVFTHATGSMLALASYLAIGGIRLDAVGINNLTSGAYLVGVFDEFVNSNATTVQAALRDFDLAISNVSSSLSAVTLQQVTNNGNTTTHSIQFAGGTSTADFVPGVDDSYSLGLASLRWRNIFLVNLYASGTAIFNNLVANNVTTTNLTATGTTTLNNLVVNNVSTTSITINGTTVTSVASTLQDVTNNGNVTTNSIQFAGGTSTASLGVNGALSINGIRFDSMGTNATTSGAYLSGVFDNFVNFNASTVQDALKAIDALLVSGATTSSGSYFVGLTAASYNGSFSAFGKVGYQAANEICNAEYAGSHFCRTDEMLQTISDKDISALFVATTFGWIAEGPPGYTANSNDCTGYTTSNNLYLGAFWGFDPIGGGAGWLTNCSNTRKISCCKK